MWFVYTLIGIVALYPVSEGALMIREKFLEGFKPRGSRYRD